MARPLRVEFENAIHHVTFRGNERKEIFKGDGDRNSFLERLAAQALTFQIQLYLFCLMPNHVHLLLETPHANLGAFMRSLLTSYAAYFNARHRRSGHLTQGRYHARLVEGDDYLLRLSRYIHLNPVFVSGLKSGAADIRRRHLRAYRWSSYPSYAGLAPKLEWIQYAPIRDMVGIRSSASAYARFVEDGIGREDDAFSLLMRKSSIAIGSEGFVDRVREMHREAGSQFAREDRPLRQAQEHCSPDDLLAAVADYFGLQIGELGRRKKDDWAKAVAAELLLRHSGITQRMAGKFLGNISGAAVCLQRKRLRESEAETGRLAVRRIENNLKLND